jgi:hypothetical protein
MYIDDKPSDCPPVGVSLLAVDDNALVSVATPGGLLQWLRNNGPVRHHKGLCIEGHYVISKTMGCV